MCNPFTCFPKSISNPVTNKSHRHFTSLLPSRISTSPYYGKEANTSDTFPRINKERGFCTSFAKYVIVCVMGRKREHWQIQSWGTATPPSPVQKQITSQFDQYIVPHYVHRFGIIVPLNISASFIPPSLIFPSTNYSSQQIQVRGHF